MVKHHKCPDFFWTPSLIILTYPPWHYVLANVKGWQACPCEPSRKWSQSSPIYPQYKWKSANDSPPPSGNFPKNHRFWESRSSLKQRVAVKNGWLPGKWLPRFLISDISKLFQLGFKLRFSTTVFNRGTPAVENATHETCDIRSETEEYAQLLFDKCMLHPTYKSWGKLCFYSAPAEPNLYLWMAIFSYASSSTLHQRESVNRW